MRAYGSSSNDVEEWGPQYLAQFFFSKNNVNNNDNIHVKVVHKG